MENFYVGQKLKHIPTDKVPMFEIVKITESLGGLKYYRIKNIYDGEEMIVHEEYLYSCN